MSLTLGALTPAHRDRVREILGATAVFREEEIEVALEVFDEGTRHAARGTRPGGDTDLEHPGSPSSACPVPHADYELLGAFDNAGILTGYACYGPTPSTDRTYDLYWIAVHPDAQGTGGGTRLLTEVEERLYTTDGRLLVVETSSRAEYEPTRHFYEARDYREAARISDFYAPADDRVIYTKRLASHAAPTTERHAELAR